MRISLLKISLINILFFLSCQKDPPLYEIKNLNGNKVTALGHGGSGIAWKFPIDSWESIQECLNIGADGVEIDVQMTKDCVLVAYHHQKLEEGTSCNGMIHEKRWSEIGSCLFNSPLSSHIYLMRIDDIFSRINNIQQYIFSFDCKLYTNDTNYSAYLSNFISALIQLIDKYEMPNNIFIESSNSVSIPKNPTG